MAQCEEAGKSECKTSFLTKATDKSCCGAQFFWEIRGEPRETVIIPTEASTSTLWIERECAAAVVVFLFVGFQAFHLHIHCFNLAQANKSSVSLPHFQEMSKAAGVRKPSESQKAKTFHGSGAVSSIRGCFG